MDQIKINNNLFDVKSVYTDKDISNGMMNKTFNGFDGMLFFIKPGDQSFWMKNCLIDLDIIFISNNKVSKIHKECKVCKESDESKCSRFTGYADLVLELPSGTCDQYDIQVGDAVYFES
jgi:uncharacterized membrane protein (UPF0127 family)